MQADIWEKYKEQIYQKDKELFWEHLREEDWWVDYDDENRVVIIEKWSPAGEDLSFEFEYNRNNDIISQIKSVVDNYDVDEHVEMWAQSRGRNGVPSSYRTLVEDAEIIATTLDELYELAVKHYPKYKVVDEKLEVVKQWKISKNK